MPRYDPASVPRARALRRDATFPERLLWSRLRRHQLGVRFLRQHPIDRYIIDFYCPEQALAVELDGRSHDGRAHYDHHRDTVLARLGITVIRIQNDDVLNDLDGTIERLLTLLPKPPSP